VTPELKQETDLSPADFARQPVWVGVHHYDSDQPWYEQSDEETFRPWTGPLPFAEPRGFALVATEFVLADGSVYGGYCRSVPDTPNELTPWSQRHGGDPLSLLLLQNPIIFVDSQQFDFQLRVPELRQNAIQSFFTAIGKKPGEVFPLQFSAAGGLIEGINSGKIEGFYDLPVGKTTLDTDTDQTLLRESTVAVETASGTESPRPEIQQQRELTVEDLRQHPVWIRVPFKSSGKPFAAQYTFSRWTGALPVDAAKAEVRIRATFVLRDGHELSGYVKAMPENWADVAPPPIVAGKRVIQGASPRVRYGDSPLAIIGEQLPCIFVNGKKFWFWCGVKDPDELRFPFYEALGKHPEEIFPIRFSGTPGLATGIVTGEIEGFYTIAWTRGKAPKIVR
jgi:hypothetical protein